MGDGRGGQKKKTIQDTNCRDSRLETLSKRGKPRKIHGEKFNRGGCEQGLGCLGLLRKRSSLTKSNDIPSLPTLYINPRRSNSLKASLKTPQLHYRTADRCYPDAIPSCSSRFLFDLDGRPPGLPHHPSSILLPIPLPRGPRSNLPFDPHGKGFAFKYWTFMFVGMYKPFSRLGARYVLHGRTIS